jgi:hypothetical protein
VKKYKSYKRRGFHSESAHGATQGALGGADVSVRINDATASELDLALFPSTLQYTDVRTRYAPTESTKKRYYPADRTASL